MKNPTFEVNFIVASLNPYSDLQSSMATTSIPAKITQRTNENVNLSIEDQQALNEAWDDWDMESEVRNTSNYGNKRKKTKMEEIIQSVKGSTKKDENKKEKNLNRRKKFNLPSDPEPMDVDNDADVLPPSPESPRTKKAKLVFGRCFEPTFSETYLGETLAPNSDSE